MTLIMFIMMTTIAILFLLFMINWSIKYLIYPQNNKSLVFECGFNPFNPPRVTFSLPYFILTLIFLIFDIEISLIFPFLITLNSMEYMYMYPLLISFIILLIWGLYMEWLNQALEWLPL